MKRFIINILLFFAIVGVCDFCFGFVCDYMRNHPKGGKTKQFNDLMLHDCHEVLFMGSSRAYRHYDPLIIEHNLGMDCYNAGYDGMGVIMAYPILYNMLERCKPSLVVYEVTRKFDLVINNDDNNQRYISLIKPYRRIPIVANVIRTVSFKSFVKLYSSLFRYNTDFVNVAADFIITRSMDYKGFQPYQSSFHYIYPSSVDEKYDSLKLQYLQKFAQLSQEKNVKMVWVISPHFCPTDINYKAFSFAKEIASRYNIPFLDYYYDTVFVGKKEYFKDEVHLNQEGAKLFSQQISNDLLLFVNNDF